MASLDSVDGVPPADVRQVNEAHVDSQDASSDRDKKSKVSKPNSGCGPGECSPATTFARLKQRGSEYLDSAFARHGKLVYDHAWKFIICFVVLSGLLSLGLLFRNEEFDMYKLYTYPGAPSQNVRNILNETFSPQRFNYLFLSSNGNILTKEGLQVVDELISAVQKMTVTRSEVVMDEYGNEIDHTAGERKDLPEVLTYYDLCVRDSWEDCSVLSVLQLYSSPRHWGRPITSREWPLVVNLQSQKAFRLDGLLGNMTVSKRRQGGRDVAIVTGATAILVRFDLRGEVQMANYSAALEQKIEQLATHFKKPGFVLSYKLERSISDELRRSSVMGPAEMMALTLAVMTVLAYTVIVNSTINYRTKTIPAAVSVAVTLLGYGGGAGFIYLCGVEHTPPAEATPFLVLGIGVDNAFVLLNSYCLTFLCDNPRDRIVSTARDAGISITITTMASVAALTIGAICPFMSISRFSIVTAFGLAWSYVLSLTIFLACLSLDARREYKHSLRLKKGEDNPTHASKKPCLETGNQNDAALLESESRIHTRCGSAENEASDIKISGQGVEHKITSEWQHETQQNNPKEVQNHLEIPRSAVVDVSDDNPSRFGTSDVSESAQFTLAEEAAIVSRLNDISTYELVSLMTIRMHRIWHSRREAKKHQSTLGWNVKTSWAKLIGQTRPDPNKPEPPVRGNSLEAGNVQPRNLEPSPREGSGFLGCAGNGTMTERCSEKQQTTLRSTFANDGNGRKNSHTEHYYVRLRNHADDVKPLILRDDVFMRLLDNFVVEPKGNVGKFYRYLFGKYFCRLLDNKWIRRLIFVVFTIVVGVAIYGLTGIETGITADEITPADSHLRPFFADREKYFNTLGEEVVILFPNEEPWEKKEVQSQLLQFHQYLESTGHALALYNGMALFLQQNESTLVDGDKSRFLSKLFDWTENDPVGRQFRKSFKWDTKPAPDGVHEMAAQPPPRLTAWKFTYWLPHSLDAELLLSWLQSDKDMLRSKEPYFKGYAFTPLAMLWESDPHTARITFYSLLSALLAIMLMTFLLIPNVLSVLLVATTVILVDVCLLGFMTLWGLRLNLITMVNLLLAIGYSVDSSLFLLHAFTHGCGSTREARMTEGMLLMGCAVTNGMLSTLLAVLFLIGTNKFVLVAFFKMMVLVLILSFGFGLVLLPAVLCLVGPLPPNNPIVTYIKVPDGEKGNGDVCVNPPGSASRYLVDLNEMGSGSVDGREGGADHGEGNNGD